MSRYYLTRCWRVLLCRMPGRAAALILCATVTCAAASPCEARLHALVVGVQSYPNLDKRLQLEKPKGDAKALADVLVNDLKIPADDVIQLPDATGDKVILAWERLVDKLADGDVILFFFAGHGFEIGGQNFLLGNDAIMTSTAALVERSIGLRKHLIDRLAGVQAKKHNVIGIFILDACRDQPTLDAAEKIPLSEISQSLDFPPEKMFMLYSAGIGQTALDAGGENSVFLTQLLGLLKKGGSKLALVELAQQLQYKVYRSALQLTKDEKPRHFQTPAYYDQLRQGYTLRGETALNTHQEPLEFNEFELSDISPGDIIKDCADCPQLVVVPPMDNGRQFAMGKFEVSVREWSLCAKAGKCRALDASQQGPEHELEPVIWISSQDADAYAKWLSDPGTGRIYRLPSEQEWEYAARGDKSPLVKPGETICQYANGPDRQLATILGPNLEGCDDGFGRSVAPVGRYKPNSFGLYDVLGNVWEWTSTCYDAACSQRVARGGSWRGPATLDFDARNAFAVTHRRATLGFRVMREL